MKRGHMRWKKTSDDHGRTSVTLDRHFQLEAFNDGVKLWIASNGKLRRQGDLNDEWSAVKNFWIKSLSVFTEPVGDDALEICSF